MEPDRRKSIGHPGESVACTNTTMSEPMICGDCGTVVELRKGYAGALEVACECDLNLGVKVNGKYPTEWSA